MRLLKSWLTALAPNSVRSIFTVAGARGILLMGLLSVGTIAVGTWYLTTLDVKRAEDGAFQDTANLARAFEENIIRLIQACDQILLSARASFLREGERFDLAQWAYDQKFVNDVTMQIAISDKTGILTASNLPLAATRRAFAIANTFAPILIPIAMNCSSAIRFWVVSAANGRSI